MYTPNHIDLVISRPPIGISNINTIDLSQVSLDIRDFNRHPFTIKYRLSKSFWKLTIKKECFLRVVVKNILRNCFLVIPKAFRLLLYQSPYQKCRIILISGRYYEGLSYIYICLSGDEYTTINMTHILEHFSKNTETMLFKTTRKRTYRQI